MVYIKFMYGNGYCGCDDDCYQCFENMQEPLTAEDEAALNQYGDELAFTNAAEIIDQCIDGPDDFDTEEEYQEVEDQYYAEVWSDWKIVSKEEYDEYHV